MNSPSVLPRESRPRNFGKRFAEFCFFISQVRAGKTYIWFHPDWVMMDWESYRKLQGDGQVIKGVVYDEAVNYSPPPQPIISPKKTKEEGGE
jgi:hypothetical protein